MTSGAAVRATATAASRNAPATANGMIFTVAIISPATTGLNAGERREGDRFVDQVERIDRGLVDHENAGNLGKQVGASGEGAIDPHPLARDRRGDVAGRGVLRHVAGLEPRHHDLGDARGLQRVNMGAADHRALLEHQRTLADGMDGNAALRLGDRDGAEFHDAFSALSGDSRSRAVISPMIETAISAGDTAPIGSPIGA